MYRLAICIPTYDRARLLRELLDAFLGQIEALDDHAVQIVVSDNASPDDTVDMLRSVAADHDALTWVVSPENLGPDRNYLRAVEAADAEYCWLFGSDDVPAPGAVAAVLAALERTDPDILLVSRLWCDFAMRPQRTDHLFRQPREAVFDTRRPDGVAAYLGSATTLCAVFSYLSSIVVKKARWDEAPGVDEFIGSAYAHSAKLLWVVRGGARVVSLPEPLVHCRGENDFFLAGGQFNRARIDFVGYRRLFDAYFTEPQLRRLANGIVRREYVPLRLLLIVAGASTAESAELRAYLTAFDYPGEVRALIAVASLAPMRACLRAVAPTARRLWWWRQRRAVAAADRGMEPRS